MLRERGLPTSGNKADLVTRLFEADSRLEQGVPARIESREEIRTDTPDVMGALAEANWELEREREMLRREREREREQFEREKQLWQRESASPFSGSVNTQVTTILNSGNHENNC